MRNLAIAFLLPVILVMGKPPAPGNNWSNEKDGFILDPQTKPLPIGPLSTPAVINTNDEVKMVNNTKMPTFSEIMEIIEDNLNEIEESQKQKPTDLNQTKAQENQSQSPSLSSSESEDGNDSTSSAESDESTEISTTEPTTESISESVEDDPETDYNKASPDLNNSKTKDIEESQPIKTYADKYNKYAPVSTGIPNDSSTSQELSSNSSEEQTGSDNVEAGASNSKPEEGAMTDDEYQKSPEPIEQNPEDSLAQQGTSDDQDMKIDNLPHLPLNYNDMMDKVIVNAPESQEVEEPENTDTTPTQNPNIVKYHFFLRPYTQSEGESSYSKFDDKPTTPSATLLPPQAYSEKNDYWNMYPEIPHRQPVSQGLISPNEITESEPQTPIPQVMNYNYYNPQIPNNYYQYHQFQPIRRVQMPVMSPFQPQPYFNYLRPGQQIPQTYHQQMYPESMGLGFNGDYYRSPYWQRPSPVYSRPSYWNSYNYNYNTPNFNGMSASQYYY